MMGGTDINAKMLAIENHWTQFREHIRPLDDDDPTLLEMIEKFNEVEDGFGDDMPEDSEDFAFKVGSFEDD